VNLRAIGPGHTLLENLIGGKKMVDLKFLRVFAIWERVSEQVLQKMYGMLKAGALQNVFVDFRKERLKIPCELVGEVGEVRPWFQMSDLGRPAWFQLSLAVPGPIGWVVLDGGKKEPVLNERFGKWLLIFRNGTVVRQQGRKILADYLAVRQQGNKFFLIQQERMAVDIPSFIQDIEELREFLKDKTPTDLFEIVLSVARLKGSASVVNSEWVDGLKKFKTTTLPPSETEKVEVQMSKESKKKAQKKVKGEENKIGKSMPIRSADDIPYSNPRGMSLSDFEFKKEK